MRIDWFETLSCAVLLVIILKIESLVIYTHKVEPFIL